MNWHISEIYYSFQKQKLVKYFCHYFRVLQNTKPSLQTLDFCHNTCTKWLLLKVIVRKSKMYILIFRRREHFWWKVWEKTLKFTISTNQHWILLTCFIDYKISKRSDISWAFIRNILLFRQNTCLGQHYALASVDEGPWHVWPSSYFAAIVNMLESWYSAVGWMKC